MLASPRHITINISISVAIMVCVLIASIRNTAHFNAAVYLEATVRNDRHAAFVPNAAPQKPGAAPRRRGRAPDNRGLEHNACR